MARRSSWPMIRLKEQDRMNELPDDILISIISKLPLKEALATSILSTRWRYLSTYITHLNFPPFQLDGYDYDDDDHYDDDYYDSDDYDDDDNEEEEEEERRRLRSRPSDEDIVARFSSYVNMVDGTLDSHRGNRVKDLRLRAYSIKGASLEKWLVFALAKQAQVIEINMTKILRLGPSFSCTYSLGLQSLIRVKPVGLNLACLKQLFLSTVHVSDDDFALLVSTCVALETLILRKSGDLRNVSIVGHSSLKHLDISRAFIRQSFEILNVANLISLKCYLGHGCALRLENIPKLMDLSSGEFNLGMSLREFFSKMPSRVRDQLQLLHLTTILFKKGPELIQPSEFANTKRLELEVVALNYENIYLAYILERFILACPRLEILTIKFKGKRKSSFVREPIIKFMCRHKFSPFLKELEIKGYSGSQSILKLASYIITCAEALEELIVVSTFHSSDFQNRVRAQEDFRSITPDSVNLTII